MKKTYRKPKMKPYNRADNQISALDYIYQGRKGYIALDEPEQQDMPGKPDKLLVVTRHKALADLLREKGIISGDCDYMEHAGVDDVQGRDVVGNLPLHLAAHCHTITSVAMSVTLEMRGRELTLDELRKVYRGVYTYRVEEVMGNDEV